MKKQWILFTTLLTAFNVGVIATEREPTGKKLVETVEESYTKGAYDKFLKALDEEYRKAGKSGLLSSVFKEMKKWNIDNEALLNEALQDIEKNDPDFISELDQRLSDICREDPHSDICKKVTAVLHPPLTEKQKEALKFLGTLKNKLPNDKINTPENKLIAIEAEYDLKISLLQLALLRKDKKATIDAKKKLALNIEKFRKMEEAAAKFEDPKWKTLIQEAKSAFEDSYETRIDYAYLKDLSSGKIQPQTPTEENIKVVMKEFLDKKEDKIQKILKNVR